MDNYDENYLLPLIDNKDLNLLISNNKKLECLIKKYGKYKKIEGGKFAGKKNKFLHFLFKYKRKGDVIYGPSTFGVLTNINISHLIDALFILIKIAQSKRIYFKNNKEIPYAFQSFNLKLYEYFLSKNYQGFYGTIHEIEYMPELILAINTYENNLYGVQHGAGYLELKNIPVSIFEIKFYKIFYSWMVGPNKIKQTRFTKLNKFSGVIFSLVCKVKINWVLSGSLELYNESMLGDYYYHPTIGHSKKIASKLENFEKKEIRIFKHPTGINHYGNAYINQWQFSNKPQWRIGNNQLSILDSLNHTILYYFLDLEIPFIAIIEKKLYQKLTSEFCLVVNELKNLGIVYVEDYDVILKINNEFINKTKNNLRIFNEKYRYNKLIK